MEPFGFVPLESMACGTAVVGVNEAGVRESVRDGETGLLVERDEAAFAEAIARVGWDRGCREHLGRQGRAYVTREWTWDRSIQGIERHLVAAVGGAR
jgi:glycosyltransferase involved in cell wall biosynthesis